MTYQFIDTQAQLSQVTQKMSDLPTLFLDTEFIKRNTYYPILGLIQINLDNGDPCYLIDAVELDLKEFWQALYKVKLIVMHACSEDVDIIHQEATNSGITTKLPAIFDTQIGLSFLDMGLQLSYQASLANMLNVNIDKGESCSDWLARPLREEQLTYAVNDVAYLPQLYKAISAQLAEKTISINLYDCVLADSNSLAKEMLHQYSDADIYNEWVDFRYNRKQLAQLQQLCKWREKTAREANVPRTFIIKKSSLRDMLQKQPTSKKDLSMVNDFRGGNIKKYGDAILACLNNLPAEEDYPKKPLRPFKEPADINLSEQIKQKTTDIATKLGIPSDVLMRKRWRTRMYEFVALYGSDTSTQFDDNISQLHNYLQSWRYHEVTLPLLNMMNDYYPEIYSQVIPREQQANAIN